MVHVSSQYTRSFYDDISCSGTPSGSEAVTFLQVYEAWTCTSSGCCTNPDDEGDIIKEAPGCVINAYPEAGCSGTPVAVPFDVSLILVWKSTAPSRRPQHVT